MYRCVLRSHHVLKIIVLYHTICTPFRYQYTQLASRYCTSQSSSRSAQLGTRSPVHHRGTSLILHCSSSAGTLDVGLPNNMSIDVTNTSTSSPTCIACLPQAHARDVALRSMHVRYKVLNTQAMLPDHARHVIAFTHKSFVCKVLARVAAYLGGNMQWYIGTYTCTSTVVPMASSLTSRSGCELLQDHD